MKKQHLELHQKIINKNAHISIIGLGYVGLPLLLALGKIGFSVTGIDIDKEKDRLNNQIIDMKGRLNAVNKKLDNDNFIKRAPKDVILNEQEKQQRYISSLNKLKNNLQSLE